MRKERDVLITAEGRDRGKTFHLREMPASQAEFWSYRVLSLLARSGVDLPANFVQGGVMSLFTVGAQALLYVDVEEAKPLLDEMMRCVESVAPDATHPEVTRPVIPDVDIEEVSTYIRLRTEIFELMTGFSVAAPPSKSTQETSPASGTTRMFRKPSGQ